MKKILITGLDYARITFPFGDHYWYDLQDIYRMIKYRPDYDSRRMLEDAWRHFRGEDIGVIERPYPKIPRRELSGKRRHRLTGGPGGFVCACASRSPALPAPFREP